MDYFKHPTSEVSENAKIGKNTKIWHYAQVREGAKIGKECILGKDVYIDTDVKIGDNVKIQNGVSIYRGVIIKEGVFIGPHVCFTNDKHPRAIDKKGNLKTADNWQVDEIFIKKGASIGANSTILPGITIGEYAMIGAGSVVAKDVPAYSLVYGNPAEIRGTVDKEGNTVKND